MKPEDRERLFAQLSASTDENTNSLNQLQIQQQLLHRLSKEERDRFLAAAFYQQQQQQQQQSNPLSFHSYPWTILHHHRQHHYYLQHRIFFRKCS